MWVRWYGVVSVIFVFFLLLFVCFFFFFNDTATTEIYPLSLHDALPIYEGVLSTLCAGCGHDSITAAIVEAFWELSIAPEKVIKLSGIGCSSKTPAYFLSGAHGFNSVHGRMPSVATGALAGNRDLVCIGVSGDGDSLSIGFGQFGHAVRRNVNMLYIIENNGVYGLTKGQYSASADKGSRSKKGVVNQWKNIDSVSTAISMGGSFVARSFSGDRDQLVRSAERRVGKECRSRWSPYH